jgi:hypothetical protein
VFVAVKRTLQNSEHVVLMLGKTYNSLTLTNLCNYYSNKMHSFFIIKSTRYYNLYFFCLVFLPLHVSTRVGHLQGAQCPCLAKVIIDYNLLKLR